MGNSSSSSGRAHHDDTVDYGALVPQGVYTGPRDWNQPIVSQLIVARRLAPFYRPLEDYDDRWDDDRILAARKLFPDPDNPDPLPRTDQPPPSSSAKSKRPGSLKDPSRPEAQVYRGAVECPICFLYYPPNINHSRCCDQAICTECFVQIKRNEPTTTHMVSESAACPYCVQENFGVVYTPPPWRAGLGSEGSMGIWSDVQRVPSEPTVMPTHKRRQKSFGADSPEVVLTDHIRPDWEAKLEAVRAAVARRANRRIIMRQVGDRLIPVGVTSGRVHALSPEEAAAVGAEGGSSGRRSRRNRNQNGGLEQYMGMSGQDLEELMMLEAMRLSLLDHEEHQRKEAEEKKKKEKETNTAASDPVGPGSQASSSAVGPSSLGPGPSTLGQSALQSSSSTNLSISPSSQSSSSVPPSPQHHKLESVDSLSPTRKSWLRSRSRTPPPPNPVPNIPQSEENQAAWQTRATGPPQFSTMRAALTSTSTAAAVLGGNDPSPTLDPQSDLASSSVPAQSDSSTNSEPIPLITVVNNDTAQVSDVTTPILSPPITSEPSPEVPSGNRDSVISSADGSPESSEPSVEASSSTVKVDGVNGGDAPTTTRIELS